MSWECFMVVPVAGQEAWLRRYTSAETGARCPLRPGGFSFHHAGVHIGRIGLEMELHDDGTSFIESTDPGEYASDSRWPTTCRCGYEFTASDEWQVLGRQLWQRIPSYADTTAQDVWLEAIKQASRSPSTLVPGADARIMDEFDGDASVAVWGPGAMFDAFWLPEAWRGADGLGLTVKLPGGGVWHIDSEANGGGHWSRSGVPPMITATPSIWSHANAGPPSEYHGFLQAGKLTDDITGATY